MQVSAASLHPGGVQVLMGDVSVQFISQDIDLEAWRALGTRSSGEKPPRDL
jgi:Protein of unknown function (DUF1559)